MLRFWLAEGTDGFEEAYGRDDDPKPMPADQQLPEPHETRGLHHNDEPIGPHQQGIYTCNNDNGQNSISLSINARYVTLALPTCNDMTLTTAMTIVVAVITATSLITPITITSIILCD